MWISITVQQGSGQSKIDILTFPCKWLLIMYDCLSVILLHSHS